MFSPAILVLEDGSVFKGLAIGAEGTSVGEVVFNTAMSGYQEILTDPSYAQQIVTLTYPHIGNTGTNVEDEESTAVWATGLVVRDLPLLASNYRNEQGLQAYLQDRDIVAIADIDTRRLTRILREKGAQNGCLMAGDDIDEARALQQARAFAGLKGMDLAWALVDKNHPLTAFVFDLTGLLIFVGIAMAYVRGGEAERSRAPGLPAQDRLALGLIGGIVLVGFILEAMRIALTGVGAAASGAFIGYPMSVLFAGMTNLSGVYGYIWYLHAILTGAFIAYLPFSRLMHIIMAPVVLAMNAVSEDHH